MKVIANFLILFCCSTVFAQFDYEFKFDDDNKVYFDKVIEVSGLTKDEIYLKGKEWVYRTYKSGDSVIEFEDKESGKIFGRGNTQQLVYRNSGVNMNGGRFKYKITLLFKDGRSKIVIDDLVFKKGEMMGTNDGALIKDDYPSTWGKFAKKHHKKQWDLMRAQAIEEFESIIKLYETAITKQKSNTDDDW